MIYSISTLEQKFLLFWYYLIYSNFFFQYFLSHTPSILQEFERKLANCTFCNLSAAPSIRCWISLSFLDLLRALTLTFVALAFWCFSKENIWGDWEISASTLCKQQQTMFPDLLRKLLLLYHKVRQSSNFWIWNLPIHSLTRNLMPYLKSLTHISKAFMLLESKIWRDPLNKGKITKHKGCRGAIRIKLITKC